MLATIREIIEAAKGIIALAAAIVVTWLVVELLRWLWALWCAFVQWAFPL